MHIHGASTNSYAANLHPAAQSAQVVAAQRAAETRKKLMKAAQGVEGEVSLEESLMIGRWLNTPQGQDQSENDHPASATGRDSDFG